MANIVMVEVISSVVKAIGYHEKGKVLQVQFKSGATYQYMDVPPEVHKTFMADDSKGKYINHIIAKAYSYVKVG